MNSPEKSLFHVAEDEAGMTLAAFLKKHGSNVSWNDAKKLVLQRRVAVNGATCLDVARRLKPSEVIHLFSNARSPQPTADDIEILYLDKHVAVVVKPALMTTLRHAEERNWDQKRKNLQPTLDELLPKIIQQATRPNYRQLGLKGKEARKSSKASNQPLPHVRAVHRLDRDTSGVMVFALDVPSEVNLIRQFKKHSVDRVYRAIVHGSPVAQTIKTKLTRDRGDGLRGSSETAEDGQEAITHVRPIKTIGDYSLIECRLETGRTHQIRIHLSELGHMLCGETTYTKSVSGKRYEDSSDAPRLALHAAELAFDHPVSSERLHFEAPFPADLQRFLKRLES